MKVTVSILLSTRNRAPYLARTLERIAANELPNGFHAEIIVVNNGGTDETPEVVRHCNSRNMEVRLISEPHPGKALACNKAIAAAKGDILLFTDDDVLVPRDWIAKLCMPIVEGRADAISGAVVIPEYLNRHWMTHYHRSWLGSTEEVQGSAVENMVGGNMACSRKVLQLVPGMDPELGPGMLGYHEETLFTWQLKLAGFRVRHTPEAVVEHWFSEKRLTRESMLNSAMLFGRSSAYLAHHWEHRRITHPRLQWIRAKARLAYWRLRRNGPRVPQESCPQWEMEMVSTIWYYQQYLQERKRPRNYKALALRKEV